MSRNNAAAVVMEFRALQEQKQSSSPLNSTVTSPTATLETASSSPQAIQALSNSCTGSSTLPSLATLDASVEPGCSGACAETEEKVQSQQNDDASDDSPIVAPPGKWQQCVAWCQTQHTDKVTSCNQCCGQQVIGAVDLATSLSLSATAARSAGGMIGLALAFTADCWLEHPPYIGDVIGVLGSLGATVVLNSIEWEVIISQNEHVHQQVITVMLVCYGVIFFQGGIVIWHLVQAPHHSSHWEDTCYEACCAAVEGYFCLLVLSGCSLLRFAAPLEGLQSTGGNPFSGFGSLAYSNVSTNSLQSLSKGGSIGVSVAAALLLVAGMLLQLFATFGKYGTNTAIFTLAPIVVLMPMLLITRVKAEQSTQRCGVWSGWACFIPAMLYTFSNLWPWALHHRGYLNTTQLVLSSLAVVCFLLTARCLVCIIGQKVQGSRGWQV